MIPDFKLDKVRLFNCDCMNFMAEIPDNYYDLAIVDPPYGIKVNHNMGRRKGNPSSDYKKVNWDNSPPDKAYFDELFRISKNQIIRYCKKYDLSFIDPEPPNPNAIFYADGGDVKVGDKVKSTVGKELIRENTVIAYRGCLAFERESEKYPVIIANCGYIEWDNNRMTNAEKVEK